mmetsp:Transcript_40599/g.39187  ORF Transcript_40599/g.39187 Transcript_40599/m.39187 type:complete len:134 (+) Transcript_40599:86-487(+)
MSKIPTPIRNDILLSRYQEAVQQSIIFKNEHGEVDVSMCNSMMGFMEFRTYLANEFIIKGGSYGRQCFILLDGEAVMVGMDNSVLGVMSQGCHFNNDLMPEQETYAKKKTLHILTRTLSIVGVISIKNLRSMY